MNTSKLFKYILYYGCGGIQIGLVEAESLESAKEKMNNISSAKSIDVVEIELDDDGTCCIYEN